MIDAKFQSALEAYKAGKSLRQVAREHGVNYETMRVAFKRQGHENVAFRGPLDAPWTPEPASLTPRG